MGKLSEEERRLRREKLILFISEHQPVRGKEICAALYNGARQSFNDDMRAVNKNGPIIINRKGRNGGYCIETSGESAESDADSAGGPISSQAGCGRQVTNKLSRKIIRQWWILAILSCGHYIGIPSDNKKFDSNYKIVSGMADRDIFGSLRPDNNGGTDDSDNFRDNLGVRSEKRFGFHGMKADVLLRELHRYGMKCSKVTLYGDLRELIQRGLVWVETKEIEHYYYSCSFWRTDSEKMERYVNNASEKSSGHSRMSLEANRSILEQIHFLLPYTDYSAEGEWMRYGGKSSELSMNQIAAVMKLEEMNYDQFALKLSYNPNNADFPASTEFSMFYSGPLVYSVETTKLYLLGKVVPSGNSKSFDVAIDVEKIDFEHSFTFDKKIPAYGENSVLDLRDHFDRMFREMFGISVEPAVKVRVLAEDRPFITAKFRNLKEAREEEGNHPKFEYDEESACWVYEDRIRGIGNFARYLRGFGRGVIAKSPEALVCLMKQTNEKMIRLYTETVE